MDSFTYDYPVKNHFGEGAIDQALDAELGHMGDTVMLTGGCAKKLKCDEVFRILVECR